MWNRIPRRGAWGYRNGNPVVKWSRVVLAFPAMTRGGRFRTETRTKTQSTLASGTPNLELRADVATREFGFEHRFVVRSDFTRVARVPNSIPTWQRT